jgi:hypothetical protein
VSPTATSEETFVFEGEEVSYSKYRYRLAIRNQKILEQVNQIATQEALTVVGAAEGLDRQELGGFLRTTLPAIVDKYGNVNAVAAMDYYDSARDAWFTNRTQSLNKTFRKSQNRRADRFARAKLQGQLYKATVPAFDLLATTEPVIGISMSAFAADGFDAMKPQLANSLTRAVASYHRNTMLYNSALDEAVVKVQRVASPNACEFCRLAAFQSFRGNDVRTADYAIKFHDNCHCTIETLYEGDSTLRPEYYDDYENEYLTARDNVGSGKTKDILKEMRRINKQASARP